jgi:hypothetical protein
MSTFVQTTLNFEDTQSAEVIRLAEWKTRQAKERVIQRAFGTSSNRPVIASGAAS